MSVAVQEFTQAPALASDVTSLQSSVTTNTGNIATLTTAQALDALFSPATNQILQTCPLPAVPTTFGPISSAGVIGTATARVPDNTNYGSRKARVGFVTAAGATSSAVCLYYSAHAGNTGYFSRETGFALKQGALLSAVSVNYSWILGVGIGADFTMTTPSSLLNKFYVGADATDTNAQVMYNDGSGACTKIDLGANFPARTVGDFYDVLWSCTPGGASISYTVNRHTSAGAVFTATGTITGANQPVAGTQFFPIAGCCNGAAGGAVAIDPTGFTLAIPL